MRCSNDMVMLARFRNRPTCGARKVRIACVLSFASGKCSSQAERQEVRDDNGFSVDVVPETLRRTNLSDLTAGDSVNLERPMKADDRFGGHIVQGHVDGTGAIESIEPEGEALLVRFTADDAVMRYVVEKGFITVDGASLTVVNCDDFGFLVSIIPYTRDNTKFATWKPGDTVNLEIDVIAKYVEKLSTRS